MVSERKLNETGSTGGGMHPADVLPDPRAASVIALVRGRAQDLYPLITIVGLLIWFSTVNGHYLTSDNFLNIGSQGAVLLLVALAGTMVILVGSIDLSVGGTVILAGIVCAKVTNDSGALLGLVAAVGIGLAVGITNALVMLWLRIPSFLVTLGMLSVVTGAAGSLAKDSPVFLTSSPASGIAGFVNGTEVLSIPNVVFVSLAATIVLSIVAFRTKMGRYMYAIGGGEEVAAVSGVPVARYKTVAFALSGALCGLAATMLVGQIGAGLLAGSTNLLLDSIAAIVMGGTALSGGVGGPPRTLIGVAVIVLLSNGLDVIGSGPDTQSIVKGIVIMVAVATSIDRKKYSLIK